MAAQTKTKKILLAKMGLDGHDNGMTIVAKWLRDAGFEVVYAGIYNTSERIVNTARQEDVQLIGLSFLGGEHRHYSERLVQRLKEEGMDDIKIILGGVIPKEDIPGLKSIGISEVFTPGTMKQTIIDYFNNL